MPIPVPKQTEIQTKSKSGKMLKKEKKYQCIAKGCEKREAKKAHSLAIGKETRHLWLKNLGREDLLDLPVSRLKHKYVCDIHFGPSHFTYPGSGRLLRQAVPFPVNPPETETVELKVEEQIPIEDEIIATGEVTAPLLCDNKMLLKTKSTYSKNKYEMTFKDTTPLPSSIVDDALPANTDESFENEDIDNPPEIINDNNNKKRKYSETFFDEEFSRIEENDKYDDTLLSFLQELGSLPKFLDVIFGFLYRRTDYYEISSEANVGVGLPEGVAQKLLWQAFKKYETPKIEEPPKETPPPNTNTACAETKTSVVKKTVTKDKSDVRLFKTNNGAVFENYAWSQTTTDVDVQIKIPDKITCKQLQIDIGTSGNMLIKQRNTDICYLTGELCKKCKVNETVWSLGGHILQIHLEKDKEGWWDCLLKAEPRLDFNKMNFAKFEDIILLKEEVS